LIVVDASAVLELLLQTPAGVRVSERIFAPGETLHAPHLLGIEVAHVLRRYARSGIELRSAPAGGSRSSSPRCQMGSTK
jgi:predicted nucleic acid-binding protein